MPLPPLEIKAELVRRGITVKKVAKRARVSDALASAVIYGERSAGRDAKRTQRWIAKLIERPLSEVFQPGDAAAA